MIERRSVAILSAHSAGFISSVQRRRSFTKEYMCTLESAPCPKRCAESFRCNEVGPGCGFRKEIMYEVLEEKKSYVRLPRWYEKYYEKRWEEEKKKKRWWIEG